jgi:hypothetical protein
MNRFHPEPLLPICVPRQARGERRCGVSLPAARDAIRTFEPQLKLWKYQHLLLVPKAATVKERGLERTAAARYGNIDASSARRARPR